MLEYDALFIEDGVALLEDFRTFIGTACDGDEARTARRCWFGPGRRCWAGAGGTAISSTAAIQHQGHPDDVDVPSGASTLGAVDFLRTPGFSDLCRLLKELSWLP